jgi:hypothetical protein
MKYRWIIVSDGGAPLQVAESSFFLPSLLPSSRSLKEISAISLAQSTAVRKRWLIEDLRREKRAIDGLRGTYFGIASAPNGYRRKNVKKDLPGYSRELAEDRISQIRTDFDHFTKTEQAILGKSRLFFGQCSRESVAP